MRSKPFLHLLQELILGFPPPPRSLKGQEEVYSFLEDLPVVLHQELEEGYLGVCLRGTHDR
jgi:hypothetical protein